MLPSIAATLAAGHARVKHCPMDILITAMIIVILLLAVAPFFLLSSAFGAPKRAGKVKDANDGPIVPVPTDASGPFPGPKKNDSPDDDGGDGGDGGGGAD